MKKNNINNNQNIDEIIEKYDILKSEANTVRDKDKVHIKNLFEQFYNKHLAVGIGFQRAYGSILSGDYFDLLKLPNEEYLFIFADISGHGLPAYTTLIRLRAAITISIKESERLYNQNNLFDQTELVKSIARIFTDLMDEANSSDFACVNFTFIRNEDDKFHLRFYNRSMLFPIVIRKFNGELKDLYNLNEEEKGWYPTKGFLLGSDIKSILGNSYYDTPYCDFTIYEGDSLFYFSDGITEAHNIRRDPVEFGDKRIEELLKNSVGLIPQIVIEHLFDSVYNFIETPEAQKDDMTAVLIDFPALRD